MKALLFLWQLPQCLAGLILKTALKAQKRSTAGIVYYDGKLGGGVSLGEYIIVDRRLYNDDDTIRHEHGHQIQSRRLGWLYLPTVGLVSACRNIYDRVAHRDWPLVERVAWYYDSWPEKQADILGGVESRIHAD